MLIKLIVNRKDLKTWLAYEKKLYNLTLFDVLTMSEMWVTWKYVKYLRMCEYLRNSKKKYLLPLFLYYRRKKNILGMKTGLAIGENCVGKGLLIYHNGNVVINGNSEIGENLKLHGNNCIGNNGKTFDNPKIGDNVELGVGASIIGNVEIANDVIIGANATVVNSCLKKGEVLIGVPAKSKNKDK